MVITFLLYDMTMLFSVRNHLITVKQIKYFLYHNKYYDIKGVDNKKNYIKNIIISLIYINIYNLIFWGRQI